MIASAFSSDGGMDAKLAPMGILPQVREYRKLGDQARLEARIPDDWIDHLAIAGAPEDWGAAIDRLVEVGAHSVVLVPLPDRGLDEVEVFARHLVS